MTVSEVHRENGLIISRVISQKERAVRLTNKGGTAALSNALMLHPSP
jgi:hypothetical protein